MNGMLTPTKNGTKLDLLLTYMNNNKIDIISINEHRTTKNCNIPNSLLYRWFPYHCTEGKIRSGGAGLWVHKFYDVKRLEFKSKCQHVLLEITHNNKKTLLGSFYLPQKSNTELQYFRTLLKNIYDSEKTWNNMIIVGDTNAWHHRWDPEIPSKTCGAMTRGNLLNKILNEFNLHVLTPRGPTRIGNKNQRNSYVDLFITNDNNLSKLSPQIDNSFLISDHRIQILSINDGKTAKKKIIDFKNTNINTINEHIEKK